MCGGGQREKSSKKGWMSVHATLRTWIIWLTTHSSFLVKHRLAENGSACSRRKDRDNAPSSPFNQRTSFHSSFWLSPLFVRWFLVLYFSPDILQKSFLSFGARSKRKGACQDDVESSIQPVSLEEDRGHQEVSQRARPSARPLSLIRQQWQENWEICTFILKKILKPNPGQCVWLSVHMMEIEGGIRWCFELPLKEFGSLLSLAVTEKNDLIVGE